LKIMNEENEKTTLIDAEFFETRRQVGEGFIEKLVQVFNQEAPKLIHKIQGSAKENNVSELAELGHKLKGMCLNVGATQLSILGKEIEFSAKNGEVGHLDTVIDSLEDVLKRTLKEMDRMVDH